MFGTHYSVYFQDRQINFVFSDKSKLSDEQGGLKVRSNVFAVNGLYCDGCCFFLKRGIILAALCKRGKNNFSNNSNHN